MLKNSLLRILIFFILHFIAELSIVLGGGGGGGEREEGGGEEEEKEIALKNSISRISKARFFFLVLFFVSFFLLF